jgi:predicted metal-dependent HD superfamily phosphohydrolase
MPRVDLQDELRRRWANTLPDADDLGSELVGRYAEPQRVYHDGRHLLDVLEAVDALGALADDPATVKLAGWFHDAVYEVGAEDNEERSALLAEHRLQGRVPDPAAVGRLVRTTATHDPGGDRNAMVLCDADLAVLGAPSDRYAAYAEEIRREHATVPAAVFGPARAAVLRGLMERPYLYRTEPARERWERQARLNIAHEVSRLPG